MSMSIKQHSGLYRGRVWHARQRGPRQGFSYAISYYYIDLDELDHVFAAIPGHRVNRWAPYSFRESDYLKDRPEERLKDRVAGFIAEYIGVPWQGRVRVLTQLRQWGAIMNPLTVFYAYDESGHQLQYLVGEVSNTPWNERHLYLIPVNAADQDDAAPVWHRMSHRKEFHVSPFFAVSGSYHWRFNTPDDLLQLDIRLHQDNRVVFDARMILHHIPLTARNAWACALRYPWFPLLTLARIYRQAFRLWRQRATFFPHSEPTL